MIGRKIGTGGSVGASYQKKAKSKMKNRKRKEIQKSKFKNTVPHPAVKEADKWHVRREHRENWEDGQTPSQRAA